MPTKSCIFVFKVFYLPVCVSVSTSGDGYWVGKASLRSWRQLALEQLEKDEHESEPSNGQSNGNGSHANNSQGQNISWS